MKRTENVSPDEIIPQWSKKKFAALHLSASQLMAAGLLAFNCCVAKIDNHCDC